VLDMIDAKAKAGTVDDTDYVYALEAAGYGDPAPAAKPKVLTILKDVISNKKNGYSRSTALDKLVSLDKSQKGYAQQYANDDDLKDTVKSINSAK
jgi:hypothetical protein